MEENEKVCDTLNVNQDLFREKELATVLKRLQVLIVRYMSFINMVAPRLEISY